MSKAALQQYVVALEKQRDGGHRHAAAPLNSPQGPWIVLEDGRRVLNLCSNDYLGLANEPAVRCAAAEALERWGFGLASGRIICGTQAIHRELEQRVSAFLRTDETILYTSCFDANAGLFEPLLGPGDAVISDQLNHASIIDGIRLCKAQRYTFRNRDLADLRSTLKEVSSAPRRLIVTDGVFSMDGSTADLCRLCDLAEEFDALLVVDDSHGVGVLGPDGRGTTAQPEVEGRVDLVTGTFGKAFGGAGGGFTSGRWPLIETLRRTSRSYIFTNALAPPIVAAALAVLDRTELREFRQRRCLDNARYMRELLVASNLQVPDGLHPIIPVIVDDDSRADEIAGALLNEGVYVVALKYPVVPRNTARIRLQISATHEHPDLEFAARAISRAIAASG